MLLNLKKTALFLFLVFCFLFLVNQKVSASPAGLGLGVCHWPGTSGLANSSVDWFYWGGGGGQEWRQIEAVKGVYDFSQFDSELASQFAAHPNSYVWLNIFTAAPTVVPDWTKPTSPTCAVNNTSCNPYGYIQTGSVYSTFAPWNTAYQNALSGLINATANHIKNPNFPYRDRIKGVIVMAGGYFGEMITWHDPAGAGYQDWVSLGYTDGTYGEALVNHIVPIYQNAFSSLNYPLVIQLSSGLSGNTAFTRQVIDSLYSQYPEMRGRIYFKYNSWKNISWNGDVLLSSELAKHNVLRDASSYTKVGWEPGVAPSGGDTASSLYTNIINSVNYTNASFFCLQDGYFNILSSTQIAQIDNTLGVNAGPTPTASNAASPTPTSTPTPTVALSPSPTSSITVTITTTITTTITPPTNTPSPTTPPDCQAQKLIGDYNCDQRVDNQDFEDWKSDYLSGQTDLADFEYWRRNIY